MDGIGAEVSQKIRSAIKAKLTEIGVYVDEELPDYVMVMVANKRSKEQMDDDLQLFLGKHTPLFTTWLHQVLQKLQEVTVANIGVNKRKIAEDKKKKKKSKLDVDKKEEKTKIKVEPEENAKHDLSKSVKEINKEKTESVSSKDLNLDCDETESKSCNDTDAELRLKERRDSKLSREPVKERKLSSSSGKSHKQLEESSDLSEQLGDKNKSVASKPQSLANEAEDLDDADCINIRTDGELLDTTEEPIVEQFEQQTEEKDTRSTSKSSKSQDENNKKVRRSPVTLSEKSREKKRQRSHTPSSPPKSKKVLDARELLNRRKAAKQTTESESRSRKRSLDRSLSPAHKRRSDNSKSYREDKDQSKRSAEDVDRNYSHRESRERKDERVRDSYSNSRRREESRTESDKNNRNDSVGRREFRNNDDWSSSRSSKTARISEKNKPDREVDSSARRKTPEEPRKRVGVQSQVVARSPEPEEDVDTPVPSVVKVTPRPRRPASQQPSSTLIMKAISEANRSLATVPPPRPDSTQQARRKPVYTRVLRQLEQIPPEKIAISITNSLALQNAGEGRMKKQDIVEEPEDESTKEESLNHQALEVTSSEPDNIVQDDTISEDWENKEEYDVEEETQPKDMEDTVVEPSSKLESVDETLEEELSDPQFVVTLNGYDPDGLYSQCDLGDDDWMKGGEEEDPMSTSTPEDSTVPLNMKERLGDKPSVNHSNLITVDIMKGKSTERCMYWPACRLAEKCTFYHPTIPCKAFPACKFGDSCLYIHPQCKFNTLCTRKGCVFSHNPAHTPLQPQAAPKISTLYAASAPLPCKFYPNCTNVNCQFAHPPRACRYGSYCTKKDCSFDHGQVPPVDKLKWTRPTST